MTRRVLAFGDSNTFGTPPMRSRTDGGRFGPEVRWPRVMAARLGCEVVEEGLPGRTAGALADPVMGPATNGLLGLDMALRSHGTLDDIVILLGTNDLKAHFGLDAKGIAANIAGLLALVRSAEMTERHGGARITLLCPPPVREVGPIRAEFWGAEARGAGLAAAYAALAEGVGCGFFDAGSVIAVSGVDGVHFEAEAQVTLGRAVAAALS